MEFEKEIKGCKVNLATRNGVESFVGLIADINEDWVKLVPFAPDTLKEKFSSDYPNMDINPIPVTMYKRMSTIDTFIILEKPENFSDGKNKDKDTEDK